MKPAIAVLLSLPLVLPGSATFAVPRFPAPSVRLTATPPPDRMISGGQEYKSPHHTFTIVVPAGTDFARLKWRVMESYKKGDSEFVLFRIVDFGEMYKVGVVETPAAVDFNALAQNAAISDRSQMGRPFELIEETKVKTQFGEGSLRLYSIQGGSLVRSASGGQELKSSDSYIAVLIVPLEGRTLVAAAQDDNLGIIEKSGLESWKKSLKDAVQSFLATMTLSK